MKRTGPTNPLLRDLIGELKKRSNEQAVNLWKRIALDLEKPTRIRRIVNISRINRFTKDGETIVIPGKVLGSGILKHKLNVAAFSFSQGALNAIKKANGTAMPLTELIKKNPKGEKVRIIG